MATKTWESLGSDGWRRVVFPYVGPGKRRQWAARLGKPGRPTPQPVTAVAGTVSVLLSVLVLYLVGRIATYGVFFSGGPGTWGGPTLIGAWLVHLLVAIPMAATAMWLLIPVTNLIIRGLR